MTRNENWLFTVLWAIFHPISWLRRDVRGDREEKARMLRAGLIRIKRLLAHSKADLAPLRRDLATADRRGKDAVRTSDELGMEMQDDEEVDAIKATWEEHAIAELDKSLSEVPDIESDPSRVKETES